MTAEELKALDQKRKDREDELVLLLLLLLGYGLSIAEGERPSVSTLELPEGVTAPVVAPRVSGGDVDALARLLRTTGAEEIALSMAEAHLDAFALFGDAPPDREDLARQYAPQAAEMSGAMMDAIRQAGGATLAESLLLAKYSRSDSTGLELGAERQIVTASNAGLIDGAIRRTSGPRLEGFRHVSVLDDRTTKTCTERSGLQLPATDPYWAVNWPSLHWRCRSTVVPIFGPFKASDWRPRTSPDVGFGRMPATVRRMIRRTAA